MHGYERILTTKDLRELKNNLSSTQSASQPLRVHRHNFHKDEFHKASNGDSHTRNDQSCFSQTFFNLLPCAEWIKKLEITSVYVTVEKQYNTSSLLHATHVCLCLTLYSTGVVMLVHSKLFIHDVFKAALCSNWVYV